MDWNTILAVVGIPVARSVGGWLENALEDGVIDKFEWQKLGETVLRVGLTGIMVFLGANGVGMDVDMFASQAVAFLMDLILRNKN